MGCLGEASLSHGVLEAPHLQQGYLEALLAQGRVVEGGAPAGVAVVQLGIDEQSVAVASASHDDGVKVSGHEHGSVFGVEVEVASGEEWRQISGRLVGLLEAPVRVWVLAGGRIFLRPGFDGRRQLGVADHHPLVAFHLWLQPEDETFPGAKVTQLVASTFSLLPVRREEGSTHVSICGPDKEQGGFVALTVGVEPIEAATVGGGGEEELRLAQGEALGDPRPDVVHLLGADDLRGERVWIQSQLHVPPLLFDGDPFLLQRLLVGELDRRAHV